MPYRSQTRSHLEGEIRFFFYLDPHPWRNLATKLAEQSFPDLQYEGGDVDDSRDSALLALACALLCTESHAGTRANDSACDFLVSEGHVMA